MAVRQAEEEEWEECLPRHHWCAFYINLSRRADRRERLLGVLARGNAELLRGIQRLDAVDGEQLDLEDEAAAHIVEAEALERAAGARRRGAHTIVYEGRGRLVHFDNHLTTGGVACAMSHRMALQRVAEHPVADWGLILEDDVGAAVPQVVRVIEDIVGRLPEDWDAVFLGYHDCNGKLHDVAEETANKAAESLSNNDDDRDDDYDENAEDDNGRVKVRPLQHPLFGLFAWVVRKPAAQALVASAFPIAGQVDHALSRWLVQERGRCYAVDPTHMLFFSPKSEVAEDSDVQTMITVGSMLDQYASFEGYYERMWGIDAMLEDYLRRFAGDVEDADLDGVGDEAGRFRDLFLGQQGDDEGYYEPEDFLMSSEPPGLMCPPCEAMPPDCVVLADPEFQQT